MLKERLNAQLEHRAQQLNAIGLGARDVVAEAFSTRM
jgi:hypothetical protein